MDFLFFISFSQYPASHCFSEVSNGAKIRNRYNQVPHLTQDTNGKVTNSQKSYLSLKITFFFQSLKMGDRPITNSDQFTTPSCLHFPMELTFLKVNILMTYICMDMDTSLHQQ